MAIEISTSGAITVTPPHIGLYGLIVLRSALGLHLKGIRASRHYNALKVAQQKLGSKSKGETLLAELDALIASEKVRLCDHKETRSVIEAYGNSEDDEVQMTCGRCGASLTLIGGTISVEAGVA